MKILISFFSILTLSSNTFGSYFFTKNNSNNTINDNSGVDKKLNLNFLTKKDFSNLLLTDGSDIDQPTIEKNLRTIFVNDLSNYYDRNVSFDDTRFSTSNDSNFNLNIKLANSIVSSANQLNTYFFDINATNTSKKLYGSVSFYVTPSQISLSSFPISNLNYQIYDTPIKIKNYALSLLLNFYNSKTIKHKITIKDLENDNNIQFVLLQQNIDETFQSVDLNSNQKLLFFKQYKLIANIAQNDSYFVNTIGQKILGLSSEYGYQLNNLNAKQFNASVMFVNNGKDFYDQVYKFIYLNFKYYLQKNNLGSTIKFFNSYQGLKKYAPNLVKISYLKNKKTIQLQNTTSSKINLNLNYQVLINNSKNNIYFQKSSVSFNYCLNAIDLANVKNIQSYFQEHIDKLYFFKTAEDIIDYGYEKLVSIYNQTTKLNTCSLSKLLQDNSIKFAVLNQNNKKLNPSSLIDVHQSYQLNLTIKKLAFVNQKQYWFFPGYFHLANYIININLHLNFLTSNYLNQNVANYNLDSNSKLIDFLYTTLVNSYNYYTMRHSKGSIDVFDLKNDSNIKFSILYNANSIQNGGFAFGETYYLHVLISQNDNYFFPTNKKIAFVYLKQDLKNKKLNFFANAPKKGFNKYKTSIDLINAAYLKLVQYYNNNVYESKYDVSLEMLKTDSNLNLNVVDLDLNSTIEQNSTLSAFDTYQVVLNAQNDSYFKNILNKNVGEIILNNVVNLSSITNTTNLHINANNGASFFTQIYFQLASYYNSFQDKQDYISASDIKNDKNILVQGYFIDSTKKKIAISNTYSFKIPQWSKITISIQIMNGINNKYFKTNKSSWTISYSYNFNSIALTSIVPDPSKAIAKTLNFQLYNTISASYNDVINWIVSLYNNKYPKHKTNSIIINNFLKTNQLSIYYTIKNGPVLSESTPFNSKNNYYVYISVNNINNDLFNIISNFNMFIISNTSS